RRRLLVTSAGIGSIQMSALYQLDAHRAQLAVFCTRPRRRAARKPLTAQKTQI
ncbi:MAG: hypothetical protein ACI9WU_002760, partial [Myxococcota bacterium]